MSGNHHDHNPGQTHAQPDTELSSYAKRILAIRELLIEKGIIGKNEVQERAERLRSRTPADGARVVARAWVDPEFKSRLLADPKSGLAELGYAFPEDMGLVVAKNTDKLRHLVVCTLCSCYPTALLGRPPDWYKSFSYRSRAVVDPRGVMKEFGLEVVESLEVRVLDSTADVRYLVLPQRPPGTEGMSEQELAQLVTRDSMIGVADPLTPSETAVPKS